MKKQVGPAGRVHARALIGGTALTGGEGVPFDDLNLPYHVWSLAVSHDMMRKMPHVVVSNPACYCGNCEIKPNTPTGCMLRATAAVEAARARKAAQSRRVACTLDAPCNVCTRCRRIASEAAASVNAWMAAARADADRQAREDRIDFVGGILTD